MNVNPNSQFVHALANLDSRYRPDLEQDLAQSRADFGPPFVPTERREAIILRDLAARAQNGINSLHAHLRAYWNMFDYCFSFAIIAGLTSLISRDVFPMETTSDVWRLNTIAIFSWLATPIVRRIIERLVPFR